MQVKLHKSKSISKLGNTGQAFAFGYVLKFCFCDELICHTVMLLSGGM